jgi:DNA-binding transcriptional regulator YiaG
MNGRSSPTPDHRHPTPTVHFRCSAKSPNRSLAHLLVQRPRQERVNPKASTRGLRLSLLQTLEKDMPNIATTLKQEISRVSRKEVRSETQTLKKSSTQYRADIAALKRRLQTLEQLVKKLSKAGPGKASPSTEKEPASNLRFSAKGLAAQRARLGLSAADVGLLLGVSAQSIYHWEAGKSRPRASQLPAIASLRKMGKREAAEWLEKMAG